MTSSFSQVRICSTILCNIRNSNPCKKCILTMTVLLYGKVNQIWLKIGNIWATTYLPSNIFYQIECPFHTSNINFWSFWLGFKSQYSWTIFKQTKKRIPKIFENSLEKYLVTFLSHLKKLQNLYSNSDLKSWIVSLVKNTQNNFFSQNLGIENNYFSIFESLNKYCFAYLRCHLFCLFVQCLLSLGDGLGQTPTQAVLANSTQPD